MSNAPALSLLLYPAGFGPMLSAVDSNFETGVGSWVAQDGTCAQSSAEANTGSFSLAVTNTAGNTGPAVTSGLYTLPQSSAAYTAQAYVRAATTGRSVNCDLLWYDVNGNFISGADGFAASDTTTGWTQVTVTTTAPANAVFVALEVAWDGGAGATGEVHYLDTVSFVLPSAIDVTNISGVSYVTGTIQTQRGRTLETDQYQNGTLTFSLRNESRLFDPSNTAGAYYGQLTPGTPVQLLVGGVEVFGGYVDDVQVNYQLGGISTVDFSCLDSFSLLAQTDLASFSPGPQTTGARITSILQRPEVAFPPYFPAALDSVPSIATGQSTLQAGTFDQIPALDQCQTAALSEQGWFFVDRTGVLTFFDRYHLVGATSQLTLSDTGGAGDQPYSGITQKSESILLFNRVYGTRTGGSVQYANEFQSQARFGIRTLPLAEIELTSDAQTLDLAQYIAGRYSAQNQPAGPAVRFDTFTIELQSLTSGQLTALLSLDITAMVTVQHTPPGTGSPTTTSILETIDGVTLSLDVSGSSYTCVFNLASIDERSFLVLNDPVFGTLDSGNLLAF